MLVIPTSKVTRVRRLARKAAFLYTAQREELGYPLMPGDAPGGGQS